MTMTINPKATIRKLFSVVAIFGLLATLPVIQTGCTTVPNERVEVVQTLLVAGHAADGAVELSANLYRDGHISADQARSVMDFYDNKWQPAYRIATVVAKSELNSIASPELWALLGELSQLVNSFKSNTP
ncbi:MAG: hypothetical protein MUP44_03565 [Anaerolineales bacterium]|nr:hypothetical protein [Anaerolineales bacterium]